jgi:hypothetical protein
MSVKDRRAGAKAAGVTLKDFKQGNTGSKAVARKTAQVNRNTGGGNTGGGSSINYDPAARGGTAFGNEDYNHLKSQGHNDKQINNYIGTLDNSQVSNKYKAQGGFTPNPSNTFTTAAGYEMERGAYNKRVTDMFETSRTNNPKAGTSSMTPGLESFDEDGYLSYDSTKPMWQANDLLKEAGYKAGDMLWRPGSLDNLNGRKLTGRIARISDGGIYHAEYEHDAVNSSHKSTGNAGYGGEVGLGADQYAYNRQYEQDNDVEYGQVNQQLQANGVSDQGIDDYWEKTDAQRQSIADMRSGASNYSGQQSFDNYGSSQSDFKAPTQAASNFDYQMPNVQQSMGPQYQGWQEQMGNASQSPYASRSKSSKMNFNFSPYKFQQGQ